MGGLGERILVIGCGSTEETVAHVHKVMSVSQGDIIIVNGMELDARQQAEVLVKDAMLKERRNIEKDLEITLQKPIFTEYYGESSKQRSRFKRKQKYAKTKFF